MIEVITEEDKSTFAEDFLKQLSFVGKILVKPTPSTFRNILDDPNIRVTATIALAVIARLGVNAIELLKGNEFFGLLTIAIPLYLLVLASTTHDMCKDFFRIQKHFFKQFFLAFVAIYFASVFIRGVLIGVVLLFGRFQDLVQQLVLFYQAALAIMAVHAIADLNLGKSTFAIMISSVVTGLGVGILVSLIGLLVFSVFEGLF